MTLSLPLFFFTFLKIFIFFILSFIILFIQPYADRVAAYLKAKHPTVPVVYFANGGSCYLHQQLDMNFDGISIDWRISMSRAREQAGNKVLAGNCDPMILYGTEESIQNAVTKCITQAKGHHVLNLGHGVEQDTPESSVACFVEAARHVKIN